MDLSALIFVALAVAWAVYLIPKALRHHEDSASSRSVEGFSDRLRVLARREPVDRKTSRLVVKPGRPASTAIPVAEEPAAEERGPRRSAAQAAERPPAARPVPLAARRAAARRAAQRRLRVVLTILLAGVAVGAAAALGHLAWTWLAAPGVVLVAWLVACRLMVRQELAALPASRLPIAPAEEPVVEDEGPHTEEFSAVVDDEPEAEAVAPTPDAPADPPPAADDGWDPVSVPLPTYVAKEPAARRSVRTIDLDSTGVWTSGRTAADSALAREADEARGTQGPGRSSERRASGD